MKKDLIVAVLATFCLTSSLFTIVPTRSQTSIGYDPWEDIDGDGDIDLYDAVSLLNSYGAKGDPTRNVIVTNLPLDEGGNLKVNIFNSSTLQTKETPLCRMYFNMSYEDQWLILIEAKPQAGKVWYVSQIQFWCSFNDDFDDGIEFKIKNVTQYYASGQRNVAVGDVCIDFPVIIEFSENESIEVLGNGTPDVAPAQAKLIVIGWEE